MVLTSVQGILAAVLLGPSDYGALGILILFATSVNRLLSFRMGEVVIRYAGRALERGERAQAAAVVKAAGLSEAAPPHSGTAICPSITIGTPEQMQRFFAALDEILGE